MPETVKFAVVPSASLLLILLPDPAPEITKLDTDKVFCKSNVPAELIVKVPVPKSPLPETNKVPSVIVVPPV